MNKWIPDLSQLDPYAEAVENAYDTRLNKTVRSVLVNLIRDYDTNIDARQYLDDMMYGAHCVAVKWINDLYFKEEV